MTNKIPGEGEGEGEAWGEDRERRLPLRVTDLCASWLHIPSRPGSCAPGLRFTDDATLRSQRPRTETACGAVGWGQTRRLLSPPPSTTGLPAGAGRKPRRRRTRRRKRRPRLSSLDPRILEVNLKPPLGREAPNFRLENL